MSGRSGGYWLAGLVLVLVGLGGGWLPGTRAAKGQPAPVTPAVSAPSSAAPVAAPDAPKPDPCRGGQALLDEYAAIYRPQAPPERPAFDRDDYLLALVPDPDFEEHTSSFKAVLEGIEEGISKGGALVRDRAWLPWEGDAKGCPEATPGVMIFRPQQPQQQPPRIVLVVGETPWWGVRRGQLLAALERIQSAGGTASLRVLGPTFSGSAASLRALLQPFKDTGALSFRFVSGTATAPQLPKLFEGCGDFSATVPNDTQLTDAMLAYLRPRGFPDDQIAILSESSTTFGSNVNREAGKSRVIPLRFPVDLRPLRKAVAEAPVPTPTTEPGARPPEDPHVLVLDEVARDLSRRNVRFVGVVATNPADVVLLTGRLRAQFPDARFFTLGGDILYTSSSLVSPLNGMLVAHAAPQPGTETSISLRSELTRGVYLAVRRLLVGKASSGDAPVPRISLIGNGALWEIGDARPVPMPPKSWRLIGVAAVLVFVLVGFFCIWPSLARRRIGLARSALTRQRGPLTLAVGDVDRPDLQADDAFATAGLLSVVAGAPLLMIVAQHARTGRGTACLIAVGVVLLACWSRVLYLLLQRRLGVAKPSAVACGLLALAATGLALGLGCGPPHEATLNLLSGGSGVLVGLLGLGMLAIGLWCWRVRLRFLDTHRFGHCSSANRPPIAQALGEKEGGGTGIFELERQLLDVIHTPWTSMPGVPVAVHALLLLTVVLVFGVRAPTGFEPGWRNALVVGFGLLALLPITMNFSRIVATYVVLSRLLKRLSLLPIVSRLRKLPPELTRKLQGQLTVQNADLTEVARPIAVLSGVSAAFPALGIDAKRIAEKWHKALRQQAGSTEPGDATTEHGEVVSELLEASAKLRDHAKAFRDEELTELGHEYLALLVAIFVPRYLRHFRLYLPPVLIGSALSVMMSSLYFVQPQRLITTVVFFWVASMVLVSFLIYVSFDRSAVISAIGNTKEGSVELDWTLWSRVATWGVVPLLGLLSAQNPSFSSWVSLIVSAFGPSLR